MLIFKRRIYLNSLCLWCPRRTKSFFDWSWSYPDDQVVNLLEENQTLNVQIISLRIGIMRD